ncbi:MAG: T9SS type A sorting domain-containing protein [Bacteroidetes bacterium]|nr:T9SS type A sorting domain-containing protein [Bacteroidota bacterium]
MILRYAVSLTACTTFLLSPAQVQNALDFDGLDDQVSVEGASDLIVGGTGITLTCWVYPTNPFPSYPDFDGFAGFRNEFDADFYLLQVSPADLLEGRMRTSDGTAYTLEFSGLQLDTWQFLVLTYDGSELTIYYNGSNVATAPASGSISATGQALRIGDVLYEFTDFFLDGRVDEVSLWNRGLSQSEITCIYNEGIDLQANGLQLYYKMDQGTAGGNNAGIASLTDSKGNINGTFQGLAMSGATSNFVQGADVGHNVHALLCPGETYTFNGQELSAAGVYSAAFPTGGACDSIVTLTLDVGSVTVNVVQTGATLTALAPTGPYQWLDCNNGYAPVPGATSQQFTATADGSYAVRITQNGCTDTSACYTVNTSGIAEVGGLSARVFPDPARDHVRIALDEVAARLDVVLTDVNGREVLRQAFSGVRTADLSVDGLSEGIYLIRLRTDQRQGVFRLVKE